MSHPELSIIIKQIGPAERHEYEATLTRADTDKEILVNTFTFSSDLLIDKEPQWMLDKAVPRGIDDKALRSGQTAVQYAEEQAGKLATYGQRLYGFLFGDGQRLQYFLEDNDAYAKQARITLALHGNAAILWKLPWEYIHNGKDFLALHGRFQLSRRPEGMATLPITPVQLPLRILVVVSSPEGAMLLDTEEEIGVIQDALDDAQRAGRVEVQYLDDATLGNIGDSLREFNPHVLHYTGHGAYDKKTARSFLLLENEDGSERVADIGDLRPHLGNAKALRLVVLSGCQTAQTSAADAFSGVATGMLAADIPAVVAMQFSILDNSAIQLARAFYGAIARGDTLVAAMAATRLALWQYADGPGYDWGIPALYLRVPEMRLVDASQKDLRGFENLGGLSGGLTNVSGLPLPRHFVGRKSELRQMRRALKTRTVNSIFVRGIGGIGKSSIAAKLAQRPGSTVDGVCVIRCHEVDALDIPQKIASFLQAQGEAGHADAGNLLLHAAIPPAERVRQAARLIGGKRYLFIFDNFESVQEQVPVTLKVTGTLENQEVQKSGFSQEQKPPVDQKSGFSQEQKPPVGKKPDFLVADPILRELLDGMLTADWHSTCVFTGRYQWRGYDEYVGQDRAVHIHLPGLTARQTIMMMDNLSRLRPLPLATKIKLFKKVGGHPKTIELLNGWLATGAIDALLADGRLDALLTTEWEDYFLRDLLTQLPPEERRRLSRLAIFQAELSEGALEYANIDGGMVRRWLDLSLLQQEAATAPQLPAELAAMLEMLPPAERAKLTGGTPRHSVHPVVADYLLGQASDEERQELHRWAATFYGQPFMDAARQAVAQSGQTVPDEAIGQLARYEIVKAWVAQTNDMGQARGGMARALDWQRHLFAAGEVDAAGEIVTATWSTLSRWGERDRAKGLLRRSIAHRQGTGKAVAQSNLATMLKGEGKLDEALTTYQDVYETFAALDAKQQMAATLGQMGSVYQNMGKLDEAIDAQDKSRIIHKNRGDETGQAITLHQLSMLYRKKEEHETALARSQAAEALFRKVDIQAHVAATLHEQGLIYNEMARASDSVEQRGEYGKTAVSRFQSSIDISRRIGNESGTAKTLGELGKLLSDAEQFDEAIAAFNEALAIARKLNEPVSVAIRLEFLGTVHERQGQYAAALSKYQEALALLQQYGSPQQIAIAENAIKRVQSKL